MEDHMEVEEMQQEGAAAETVERKVYLPGKPLEKGEVLECDESVYVMRHECKAGSPCLSFDIIKDNLGDNRDTFPHTAFIVGGTQSPKKGDNCLLVIKMSNLVKTQRESKNDNDDSSESEDEEMSNSTRPVMHYSILKHLGCVNRVRTTEINGTVLAASWSELARVSLWNLNQSIRDVELNKQLPKKVKRDGYGKMANSVPPLFTFTGHQTEGYGIDWSTTLPGVLATGDCTRHIHIWTPEENCTSWKVDQRPLIGHTDSVEDLQWSPNEPHVLASCSVDKSIRIWDTRAAPNKANQLTVTGAHLSDVNVISWNKKEPLIVSGGDDGFLHIWDLRQFKTGASVATFKHHTEPVTTVEWHPSEPTVFASGGADNQIALWDLAVEKDVDANQEKIFRTFHRNFYSFIKDRRMLKNFTGTLKSLHPSLVQHRMVLIYFAPSVSRPCKILSGIEAIRNIVHYLAMHETLDARIRSANVLPLSTCMLRQQQYSNSGCS